MPRYGGGKYKRGRHTEEGFSRELTSPSYASYLETLMRDSAPPPAVGTRPQPRGKEFDEESALARDSRQHDKPDGNLFHELDRLQEPKKYREIDNFQVVDKYQDSYHGIDSYYDHGYDGPGRRSGCNRADFPPGDLDYRPRIPLTTEVSHERSCYDFNYDRGGKRDDSWKRHDYCERDRKSLSLETLMRDSAPLQAVATWPQPRRKGFDEESSLARDSRQHDKPYGDSFHELHILQEPKKYREIDNFQVVDKYKDDYHGIDSYYDHGYNGPGRLSECNRADFPPDEFDYRPCILLTTEVSHERSCYDFDYDRGGKRDDSWKRHDSRERDKKSLSLEILMRDSAPPPAVGTWPQPRRKGFDEESALARDSRQHDNPYGDSLHELDRLQEPKKYREIDNFQVVDKYQDSYHGIDRYYDHGYDGPGRLSGCTRADFPPDDFDYRHHISLTTEVSHERSCYDSDHDRGGKRYDSWKRHDSRERDKKSLSRERDQSPQRRRQHSCSRGNDDHQRSRSPRGCSHRRSYLKERYEESRHGSSGRQMNQDDRRSQDHSSVVTAPNMMDGIGDVGLTVDGETQLFQFRKIKKKSQSKHEKENKREKRIKKAIERDVQHQQDGGGEERTLKKLQQKQKQQQQQLLEFDEIQHEPSSNSISSSMLEERITCIKEEQYSKAIMEANEIGGPAVVMRFLNDPEVLPKLGDGMGSGVSRDVVNPTEYNAPDDNAEDKSAKEDTSIVHQTGGVGDIEEMDRLPKEEKITGKRKINKSQRSSYRKKVKRSIKRAALAALAAQSRENNAPHCDTGHERKESVTVTSGNSAAVPIVEELEIGNIQHDFSSDPISTSISEEDLEELMSCIKKDPYLKPIVEDIEIGGPTVMMRYLNDPEVLQKLGKAMGFGLSGEIVDTTTEHNAPADYAEDKTTKENDSIVFAGNKGNLGDKDVVNEGVVVPAWNEAIAAEPINFYRFCYNCRERGHKASQCPKERVQAGDKREQPNSGVGNCNVQRRGQVAVPAWNEAIAAEPIKFYRFCYNCRERGHKASQCPKEKVQAGDKREQPNTGVGNSNVQPRGQVVVPPWNESIAAEPINFYRFCYNCSERGHKASQCPKEKVQAADRREQPNTGV
ncbi:hypothetical protein MKX01_036718 [Papaver californicum]|nr:hypothetical protein MKX01_036718 [Papaver californicum]